MCCQNYLERRKILQRQCFFIDLYLGIVMKGYQEANVCVTDNTI